MSTPILPFAMWESGTTQNSVPANDNALRNQILNGLVISDAVTAQPASPADGDIYILAATHTGTQWASFSPNDLVIFDSGTWYAFAPVEGIRVNVAGQLYEWGGTAYTAIGGLSDAPSDGTAYNRKNGAWEAASGGGSYTGTAGSITLTGSAFSIDTTYVGQTSITTLGTISTGTWQGTAVGVAYGGTGQSGYTIGDILYASAAGALSKLAAGTATHVLTSNGAGAAPSWQAASGGGGGLAGFTSSLETASPNNIINASVLTPSGGTTSQDLVLLPKTVSGGAIMLTLPDAVAAGGNKRGSNAVDLQISRTAATQVASGVRAFIAGGRSNTASGQDSFVAGSSSSATATNAIAAGATASASGARSVALGGTGSNASGADALALTGGVADAAESMAIGSGAKARGMIGVISEGQTGIEPRGRLTIVGSTTNATPVILSTNGAAAGLTNQLTMGNGVNNQSMIVRAVVIARHTGSGRSKSWSFDAHLNAVSTAVSLAAAVTPVVIADPGTEPWSVAVTAGSFKSLQVAVTGGASTTIRWACYLEYQEVSGF